MCVRAAVWLAAAALVVAARAYTIDCDHDYADCDSEISRLAGDDDRIEAFYTEAPATTIQTTTKLATITTSATEEATDTTEQKFEPTEPKPKPRLLNLNVDELQSFANALHNQTNPKTDKKLPDLSDVNLDDDEEDAAIIEQQHKHEHSIPDKFYTNLQAPFHHTLFGNERGSDESEIFCKENGIQYKIGDHMERGCEESCQCIVGGEFDCSPRCKHPYIRRGRKLNDSLCFESPVDECCSIMACATDSKPTKLEVCRYGNDTYPVGAKWQIGCEQSCSCEKNSLVTCKPRCPKLTQSDKCINVQDPNDACCEVQVCDVSQDAHEDSDDNSRSSTTSTTSTIAPETITTNMDYMKTVQTMRPLVLTEPIGSVKVLQNNSVQVNLMQVNSSTDPIHLLLSSDNGKTFQDVELKYSNLILNLPGGKDYILKTKETGTKFNFTITSSSFESSEKEDTTNKTMKVGCFEDGQYYEVGEEFHIGCSELCECTGMNTRECAVLECPSHVGLELVSKGCVRWASSPPPTPPNCCPRSARCLSDGTCHYKGVAIPNWSEVPISLTGCEQRCFCENGELDCQEVCSPLPPLPPQSLRCPPGQRPVPLNISDEDCCKHWGCMPNHPMAGKKFGSPLVTVSMPTFKDIVKNYVTPIPPNYPKQTFVLPKPPDTTDPIDVYYQHEYLNENSGTTGLRSDYNTVHIYPEPSLPYNLTKFDKKTIKVHNSYFPFSNYNQNIDKKYINSEINTMLDHKYQKFPISTIIQKNSFNSDKIFKTVKPNLKKLVNGHMFLPTYEQNQIPKTYFFPQESHFYDFKRSANHSLDVSNNLNYNTKVNLDGKNNFLKTNAKQIDESNSLNADQKIEDNSLVTILLKAVPSTLRPFSPNTPVNPNKNYQLDLEHILSQMEMDYEVNKNVGRSTHLDHKNNVAVSGHGDPAIFPTNPSHHAQTPSFLPTVPPEILPQEEIFDHTNNQDRPINSLGPIPHGILPPPGIPNYPEENKKLTVLSLLADSPTSVKMLFGLPPVLVGLRGSVDLRYTDSADEDVSHWFSQVFAPADEVLTTSRLEFRLTGLKPSTTYKVKGKLFLHNLAVEPESEVYSVRTQELPTVPPIEEKRREVDSRLSVVDVNDTTAHVSWRHFTEDELQFIDGIQVRYRPVGTPIYSMTELLHHSRSTAELINLRPSSRYEASIVLIPPPRAITELNDPATVQFTTSPYVDPYNWSVTVEARAVGSEAAELSWRGIPSPAERWVRVYRAAHACDAAAARKEQDAFRLAARDLPPAITLTGLEPNTKCRVWLELFLTNGKVKTSNVLEINTKSLDSPEPIDNVVEASSIAGGHGRSDYYGALVVVGVVAALGALTSLLLLLVLLRRHRPRSVPITSVPTAPRDSSLPPYDNPAYKLELQQETMDL